MKILIAPVHNGDLVQVSGRIFLDDEGNTYIRPRLHPAEPDVPEDKQDALDNPESKIRVFNAGSLLEPEVRSLWVSLTGTFHDGSIDATAIAREPDFEGDASSPHPSYAKEPLQVFTKTWRISKDRQRHLQHLLDAALSNSKQWRIPSSGLAGTTTGQFRTKLSVLWATEDLAAWTKQFTPEDLLVAPFIRTA